MEKEEEKEEKRVKRKSKIERIERQRKDRREEKISLVCVPAFAQVGQLWESEGEGRPAQASAGTHC